jgi:hypothetical protein
MPERDREVGLLLFEVEGKQAVIVESDSIQYSDNQEHSDLSAGGC